MEFRTICRFLAWTTDGVNVVISSEDTCKVLGKYTKRLARRYSNVFVLLAGPRVYHLESWLRRGQRPHPNWQPCTLRLSLQAGPGKLGSELMMEPQHGHVRVESSEKAGERGTRSSFWMSDKVRRVVLTLSVLRKRSLRLPEPLSRTDENCGVIVSTMRH